MLLFFFYFSDVNCSEESLEEVILSNGNFESSSNYFLADSPITESKKTMSHKEPSYVSSHICRGINDSNMVRELVMIKCFNHLWLKVARLVEPLLKVFSEAALYELSSQVLRSSDCFVKSFEELLPSIDSRNKESLPLSNPYKVLTDKRRPLLNRRPSSDMCRFSNVSSVESNSSSVEEVTYEDVHISQRNRLPSSSIYPYDDGESCLTSLPSIDFRPLSSRAGKHFLTPIPTEDRRPLTSSPFIRSR